MYCTIHIQNTAFYRKFKHWGIFTSYSGIFSRIVVYLEPCVTFGFQNPAIFWILAYSETKTGAARYIQNYVKA